MFDIIAFDADDTLWHNETLFTMTQGRFAELLEPYHDKEWTLEKLHETEMRNLRLFGYGIKGFALSMIETAVELSEGRITGAEIQVLLDQAKSMLKAPVEPLRYVRETLERLHRDFELMVITKGDLFDQESKLARSHLGDFFSRVEIVSDKSVETYMDLMERHDIRPERFLMVGNSLKSDILPVVDIGGHAVYVPYETTWAHELVDDTSAYAGRFAELEHIGRLPDWIADRIAGISPV
ncbi:HAD hydrolase-like protein [Sulfidibacter corallicola]|uniref:HAD hydrolase-like protein n=1 Tax=Sulfidibacter corallicola TaxID=2818388 RepID=A0A8A4TJP9_SULCO|nr:HAD family hydrolase [Sulfidibacter corallicola]QTD49707.1 HAD hydrolase-like protein [Sulfidibacter corallicola]